MSRKGYIAAAFAALMIQSCTIEDADESVSPNAEKLDIVSDINVQPTTTTTKFEVKSDVSWNITTDIDGSWEGFSVSPTSGTGNTEVTITTGENTTRKDRTAKLMVTTKGGVAQELVLRQLQSEPLLEVTSGTGQSLEFEAVSEASKNIAISCNTYWEIACDNWITCSKMEGTNESLTVTNVSVNVTEAQTDTVRLGAITVMAEGGKIAKINVSQQGKVIELSVSPQDNVPRLPGLRCPRSAQNPGIPEASGAPELSGRRLRLRSGGPSRRTRPALAFRPPPRSRRSGPSARSACLQAAYTLQLISETSLFFHLFIFTYKILSDIFFIASVPGAVITLVIS